MVNGRGLNSAGLGRDQFLALLYMVMNLRVPLHQGFSTGVPRDVARGSARDRDWKKIKHSFFNLLAKINRSKEKYHSLLKRALTIIIGLLYLQLTDHANVPWAVDIIIFIQGFPETLKLFQGFLQGKRLRKAGLHLFKHQWYFSCAATVYIADRV
jgi:hypothetical protein